MTEKKTDILLRGVTADGTVRVLAVSGRNLVETARQTHRLSRTATAALGRQLLMTVMMSAELKSDTDRVSTIIKGNGPGGTMICTGKPDLTVKGTITNPEVELPPNALGKLDVSGLVGKEGQLTVVRDLSMKEPYVGSTALVCGEIAEDFAQYYAVSQQQPSLVYLGVRVEPSGGVTRAAGGVLIQPLPGCTEETLDRLTELAPAVAAFAKRLDGGEEPEAVLSDLLGPLGWTTVGSGVPAYRCDCSRTRIEQALISVGAKDLTEMMEEDHGAAVQCHFCNKNYPFTEQDLRDLLERATSRES